MKNVLVTIFVTALIFTFWATFRYPSAFYYIDLSYQKVGTSLAFVGKSFARMSENVAAVLVRKPVTVEELHTKYTASNSNSSATKVRVLIVPGHEPDFGGTSFGKLQEREMNVQLAEQLSGFLRNNGNYDVVIARDNQGWSPAFSEYFKTQWDEIIAFHRDNKAETQRMVAAGEVSKTVATVYHNFAPQNVALRLYGINKWGSENEVDIAIHVHFNDYPRKNTSRVGKYSGLSVYVPEKQYANSTTTKAVAQKVFDRLAKYNPVSDLPLESDGVIETHELIAVGANNTTNAASLLIEYGYIYEPQFTNDAVRPQTLRDLAFQTYLGLEDFFGNSRSTALSYDTLMLPHRWNEDLVLGTDKTEDVLALQSALLLDGVYPGVGKTKNDCPRSGKIGPCTLSAIETFQRKYGIEGENRVVGEKTRNILNSRYSASTI